MNNVSEHKLTQRLNNILDLFTCSNDLPPLTAAHRTFGLDLPNPLSLEGENVGKFDSAIDALMNSIPRVKETISEEKFVEELVPEIRRKKIEAGRFTQAECQSFEQRILAMPVEQYRVLRDIYGVTLPQNSDPVRMGDFTIYDPKLHLKQIAAGLRNPDLLYRFKKPSGFLIECAVAARDSGKAKEVADALFYRFELIMRFFIGRRTDRFEVGILNYVGPQMRDYIVIGERGFHEGGAWEGALNPIPVEDPFFSAPSPPLAKLLSLIAAQNNQFEMHIMRCAEWIGQALSDPNAASAFVKAAIALEVLFKTDEKGVITSSIMAQIAESCAFVLGDSAARAVDVEREVKRMYGIRSSVVHSGKDSVASNDLNAFIQLSRSVVLALLSNKEFEDVDSMTKLAEIFKKKKYASLKPSADV